MSDPSVDSNEETLREVVANLPIFANDLRNNLREIVLAFHRLGATWRDDEYEQFRRAIPPLEKIIDEMNSELASHKQTLQRDLENLAAILRVRM